MSSTLILIVKSLWPFLKEILLKDKGLRDLIAENVVATFLCGCLLFLFMLFVYTANLADKNFDLANGLKRDLEHRDESIASLTARLEAADSELKKLREGPKAPPTPAVSSSPAEQKTPEPHVPKPDRPPTSPARPSSKPKDPSGSLKSYVESRLKLEQDGK